MLGSSGDLFHVLRCVELFPEAILFSKTTDLTQVRLTLGEHPSQRTRRNNQRVQEPALERGIAEDELANKV